MRRLKFDNDTVKKVSRLVCYHDYRVEATPKNVRRAMNRIGVELVSLLSRGAHGGRQGAERIQTKREDREYHSHETALPAGAADGDCVTLRQLAVGGRELMDLGMKPGRELGSMLM